MTTQGPNIEGEIGLRTKDLDTAIDKIKKLETAMNRSANQITQATNNVATAIGKLSSGLSQTVSASAQGAKSSQQVAQAQRQAQEATEGYRGSLQASINAINKVEVSHQRLEARIRESAMAEGAKTDALMRARQTMTGAVAAIDQYGNRSVRAATEVARFRKEATGIGIAVANANRAFRGQQIQSFQAEFRNLTGSVVLALGPLSGIASRMIALQGLFNRGGFAIAGFLASMTALTLTLTNATKAGMAAETQFLRMDSIIRNMGASAGITADQIMDMGHDIAAATLTSATEARRAAVALAGMGGVASESFERVLITAQGMSEQFGGDLSANTKVLARALQDPERRITTLERKVGSFNVTTRNAIQTMARQGDVAGAQALILQELSGSYDLATAAAGGLEGKLDTTSGLMDRLQERIGLTSGAMDEASYQVNRFNEAFEKFIQSDAADTLGRTLVNAIRLAGNVINYFAERAEFVAFVMQALMGGAIMRVIMMFSRLLGPAAAAVKAVGALGGALTGATGAARGLSVALSLLNPGTGLLRLLAFAAAPAVGILVSRFISSGKEADVAAEAINKLNTEMSELVRIGNSLKQIDPGLPQLSWEVQENTKLVTFYQGKIHDLRRELDSFTARGIYNTLEGITKATGVSAKDIQDNAYIIRQALISSTEPTDTGTLAEEQLDGITRAMLNLNEQGRDTVLRFLENRVALENFTDRLGEATDTLERQSSALDRRNQRAREYQRLLDENATSTQDLASSYDREAEALQKLQNDLQRAENLMSSYRNMQGLVGERNQEVVDSMETLGRVIDNINKQIEEHTSEINRLTPAYDALADDLNKIARETKNLQDMANLGTEDMSAQFALMDRIASAQQSINQLKDAEIKALGDQLELQRLVNESMDDYRIRVGEAYGDFIQSNTEAQNQAREFLEVQNLINQSFEDLQDVPAQIEDITSRYAEMREAVRASSADSEDTQYLIDRISQMEQIELDRLKKHTDELMQFRFGASTEELTRLKEERAEMLAEMYGEESELYKHHLEEMEAAARNSEIWAAGVENAEFAANKIGDIMGVMQNLNREQSKQYQDFAKAQVLISSAVAMAKAIEVLPINPVKAAMDMAIIGAQTGAQLAAINNAKYATGGYVSGPGTSTSDSIPAWLSNGEYVIQAEAVRKLGKSTLDALNQGRMPALKDGGSVMPIMGNNFGQGEGGGVSIQIIDQRSGGSAPIETEESMSPDGIRHIRVLVKDMVNEALSSGDTDRQMKSNYGVSRRPKRR